MARIRGDRVDTLLAAIQREGVRARIGHPESPFEVVLEPCGGLFFALGELVLATQASQARDPQSRGVDVALDLDEGDRPVGEAPIAVANRVPRVLPALVGQAALGQPLVLDEAVVVQIAVVVDPLERREGVGPQLLDQLVISRPALVCIEEHDPQRRRIDRAVVRRVRNLTRACKLPVAQLVQDLARLSIPPVVDLGRLIVRKETERVACDLRPDRQQLDAGDDRVASKEAAEPGHARGDVALARPLISVQQQAQVGAGAAQRALRKDVAGIDCGRALAPRPVHRDRLVGVDPWHGREGVLVIIRDDRDMAGFGGAFLLVPDLDGQGQRAARGDRLVQAQRHQAVCPRLATGDDRHGRRN